MVAVVHGNARVPPSLTIHVGGALDGCGEVDTGARPNSIAAACPRPSISNEDRLAEEIATPPASSTSVGAPRSAALLHTRVSSTAAPPPPPPTMPITASVGLLNDGQAAPPASTAKRVVVRRATGMAEGVACVASGATFAGVPRAACAVGVKGDDDNSVATPRAYRRR